MKVKTSCNAVYHLTCIEYTTHIYIVRQTPYTGVTLFHAADDSDDMQADLLLSIICSKCCAVSHTVFLLTWETIYNKLPMKRSNFTDLARGKRERPLCSKCVVGY